MEVRKDDDLSVTILKLLRQVGQILQALLSDDATDLRESVHFWQGDRMDKRGVEERKAESVTPGPNKNSLTGGKWERAMVSVESSPLEIQGVGEESAKLSSKVK